MSTENLRESIVNKLWADTELHHEDAGPIADAVLDLVAARLSEVEAERDAAKAEAAVALESLTELAPSSLGTRIAELEAERDALQRQRDEVWHRIDLWSDDPDTGLDHLLDVWTSHEKALAERDAARSEIAAYRSPGVPTYAALLDSHAKLLAEQDEWVVGYRELAAERDAAIAVREAWRPVVEAAIAYRDARYTAQAGAAGDHLVAAVDALPTRNVDSTTPGATDGD